MSTGFASRAYTDIAKNIKLKSLVINKTQIINNPMTLP